MFTVLFNIADASAITNGTSGPSAVVDASQLKAVADEIPDSIVETITEGGTDIETGALQIVDDGAGAVTIGVNKETFCPLRLLCPYRYHYCSLMALADNDLLIVQKPASKLHYKVKVGDLPAGTSIPDGNNQGDYLVWTGSQWDVSDTIDGGTY